MRTIFLIVCLGFLLFGCSGRTGQLDEIIRSEPSLLRLERQMEWTLAAAEAGTRLQREQRDWRKELERCLDAEDPARCIAGAHTERLADLQARFDLNPRGVAVYRAAREGFGFRAQGNEPGWNLLISDDRCVWETDYGQTSHDITGVDCERDGETLRYRATVDGDEWEVRLSPEPCADDMSGEPYPWQAIISWRGQKLRGCAEPTDR